MTKKPKAKTFVQVISNDNFEYGRVSKIDKLMKKLVSLILTQALVHSKKYN